MLQLKTLSFGQFPNEIYSNKQTKMESLVTYSFNIVQASLKILHFFQVQKSNSKYSTEQY